VQRKGQQKRVADWAFAPVTVGGETTGGFEWALSILNQRDPSEYAHSTGLMLESAGDLQRLWEMRNELRSLVEEWQACGQSLRKMIQKDCARAAALQRGWVAFFGADGKFLIGRDAGTQDTSPRGVAIDAFVALMNDPDRLLLGGPCERCSGYYRKKRNSQKRFCGRNCAHLASATKANQERLQRERKEKLARAGVQIEKWQALKRKPDVGWKQWVAAAIPELTVCFLTRAVNTGDLKSPKNTGQKRIERRR
jgi:hypothetical protein